MDLTALESLEELRARREAQEMLRRPSWWLGTAAGMDPFIKYPVELDSAARELIAAGKCPESQLAAFVHDSVTLRGPNLHGQR